MAKVVNINISGMSSGSYQTYIADSDEQEILNEVVTYVDGVSQVSVPEGTTGIVTGYVRKADNEKGAVIVGVAEDNGISLKIQIDGVLNFVAIGASIMQLTYNEEGQQLSAQSFYNEGGIVANVYGRGTGGDSTVDLLAKLPAYLAEFSGQEANTLFFCHIGGNNNLGIYPSANPTLTDEWREIMEEVQAAGFYCSASPISYRTSADSEPYNTNDLIPIIAELMPEWMQSGEPVIDLYNLMLDNYPTWFSDSVHPNELGQAGIRNYTGGQLPISVDQINASPDGVKDVVVQMFADDMYNGILLGSNPEIYHAKNTDGSAVIASMFSCNIASGGSSGVGNPGNNTESLENDSLLTNLAFTAPGNPVKVEVDCGGFDTNKTYTVRCVGSRNGTVDGSRMTDYTVGGVTLSKDAALNPPEPVEFTGVTWQQLKDDGIVFDGAVGATYGYLNGFQIIEE